MFSQIDEVLFKPLSDYLVSCRFNRDEMYALLTAIPDLKMSPDLSHYRGVVLQAYVAWSIQNYPDPDLGFADPTDFFLHGFNVEAGLFGEIKIFQKKCEVEEIDGLLEFGADRKLVALEVTHRTKVDNIRKKRAYVELLYGSKPYICKIHYGREGDTIGLQLPNSIYGRRIILPPNQGINRLTTELFTSGMLS